MNEQQNTFEEQSGNFNVDLANDLQQIQSEQTRAEQVKQNKANYDAAVLQRLNEAYPPEHQFAMGQLGGMEIISCGGEATAEQMQMIRRAYDRIRAKLGDDANKVLSGIRMYLAAPEGVGGGEALPNEDVIILNTAKMGVTVGQMEAMSEANGSYERGDQSRLVGDDYDASELGTVHEIGHILEQRAHGGQAVGFANLDQSQAPTWYGQQEGKYHEDYAESWMYYIYGGDITEDRQAILQADIERVAA